MGGARRRNLRVEERFLWNPALGDFWGLSRNGYSQNCVKKNRIFEMRLKPNTLGVFYHHQCQTQKKCHAESQWTFVAH